MVITDGQYASLNTGGALETGNYQDSNELSWKDNMLIFDDTPFDDVVSDLSSFYNTRIDINDIASDCPITYTKPVNSDLETTLQVLSRAYDLNWTKNPNGGYTITSIYCD